MTPALSIVIPTKNRPVQCLEAVRAVLHFDFTFELLVFDSSDDGSLGPTLLRLNDPRLRVLRAGPGCKNMTDCFEAAVQEARGTYICMIGDDDGVTPALFEWVARASEEGFTTVTSHERSYALYNWPDIRSRYFGDSASGKLFLQVASVPEFRVANTLHAARRFLNSAGQGCASLPRVYHGLVHREVLVSMRNSYRACFAGVSPDVSFSYLASMQSPRHAVIRQPLTISGASAVSNAGRSAMRIHKGDLWSDPHMKNYQGERWPAEVPEFFSVETVWAQATLAAVERAGGGDMAKYNLHKLYSILLLRHPDRLMEILASMRIARRGRGVLKFHLSNFVPTAALTAMTLASGALSKMARKVVPTGRVKVFDAPSIFAATTIIQRELTVLA